MLTSIQSKTLLAMGLVALLIAVSLIPALAQGEGQPIPEHPRSIQSFPSHSPLVIPAAAFNSDGNNPGSFFFWFSGGYARGNDQHDGCIKAPVYLPQFAQITDLFTSVYDNDTSYSISVTLWRKYNYNNDLSQVMAQVSTSSSGASNSIQVLNDDTIDHATIYYPDYSYYVTTCLLSGDIRLYSVRLYYRTFDAYLPLIFRSPPIMDMVINGGFELDQAWEFPATAYTGGYSKEQAHGGVRSGKTGITKPADNRFSYSSVQQLVSIPSGASSAILKLWYWRGSTEATALTIDDGSYSKQVALPKLTGRMLPDQLVLADDIQYVLVLDEDGYWIDTLYWNLVGNEKWSNREFDLTGYAGEDIYIHMGVYNDGGGGVTSMYVDDVRVEVSQ